MKIVIKRDPPFRELLPHQKATFETYCKNRRHLLLFHEMRLGKTLLAIRWILSRNPCPLRILVLAPITVLSSWEKELKIEKQVFLSEYGSKMRKNRALDAFIVHDMNLVQPVWFLTNYQVVLSSSIHYLEWDAVVLDESTNVRNPRAKTTKEVCHGLRNAKHRIALSGMPNPESDMDLICQYIAILGDFMGYTSFYEWRAKYCTYIRGEWFIPRQVRQQIKSYLHRTASVLSRKQAGVDTRTVYESRDIPMPAVLQKAYKQARKEFAIKLETGEFETKWEIVLQTWLARLAGGCDPEGNFVSGHKIEELVSLLTGELAKEQVVVGFRFNAEIKAVRDALKKAGVRASVLWGATLAEERGKIESRFRQGKDRVTLLQSSMARYSLDFSTAGTLIHYSRWWSNEINAQIEARIKNPLKKTPDLILDLVTKGSVDEAIVEAAKAKKINAKLLLTQLKEEWKRG